MSRIFQGFALAFSMLTTVPFFKVHNFYKGINGYGVMFYPFVGMLLGLILYAAASLLEPYVPHFHLGVIVFALWVVLTGALHLDGFADTIDALFVPKERAFEVMKDPHNGGMGMLFGSTFLLLKASSLIALKSYEMLPLILLLSRFSIVLGIYFYPYVSNGMSALAKKETKPKHVFIAALYTVMVVFFYKGWILFIGMFLVLLAVKWFFIRRYGGFTGDIYGFTIELTELFLLNLVIVGVL